MTIPILLSFSGNGGVEKMAINLMAGMIEIGEDVELLRIKSRGKFVRNIPPKVKVLQLPSSHAYGNIPFLCSYLKEKNPPAILAIKERAAISMTIAKALTRTETRIIARFGTNLTQSLREQKKSTFYKVLRLSLLRWTLKRLDGVIAVSKGVREDLLSLCPSLEERVLCIPNPVITPKLFEMAQETIDHPWFLEKEVKVAVAMGRLTQQKDFSTLISAIYMANKSMPLRLLIMGEGEKRKELEKQIQRLHLESSVNLAGFISNPYPYLKRADLFVLSSRWEGSPNALTEAMALGTAVVATDCKSGPREILKGGKVAPLVKVGDPNSLAQAIIETLRSPPSPSLLQKAVEEYHYTCSAKRYLEFLKAS